MADSTTKAPLPPAKFRELEIHSRMTLAAMRLMNGKAGGIKRRTLDSSAGSTFEALVDAHLNHWRALRGEG